MTDRLLTECTLELYEQLANINDCNHVFLIREKSTGLLFVKKVLAQYDEPIFATLKEAQIPGIPTIQHILRDGETLILIEDFVNGQTVQSLLQNGPLPEKLAIDILNQLTRILTSLHRRTPPVIHRDIKASNVIVTPDGRVFLIDFNAARKFDAEKHADTVILGTNVYAPPEQYGFAQTDCRSDVYSLAVLFHVMLSGKYPTDGLCCSEAVNRVLERALSLSPDERFDSVEAFTKAIGTAMGYFSSDAKIHPPSDSDERTPKEMAKHLFFSLPGIRTGEIIPTLGFGFVLILLFSVSMTSTSNYTFIFTQWCERILTLVVFVGTYLLCCDYCGIRRYFPGTKKSNRLLRYLILTGYFFLGVAFMVYFCMLVDAVLSAL